MPNISQIDIFHNGAEVPNLQFRFPPAHSPRARGTESISLASPQMGMHPLELCDRVAQFPPVLTQDVLSQKCRDAFFGRTEK